jgi:F-type H+-transporting ATPase subunit c
LGGLTISGSREKGTITVVQYLHITLAALGAILVDEKGAPAMAGNLHVGLAALGAAIAVGMIGMKASDVVGRNPGSATKVLVQSILAIAFAEAIVFYTLFLVR